MTTADARVGVAVVVVTHDSGATLADCVRRVLAAEGVTELVIVDNASRDGAIERVEFAHAGDARLRVIRNTGNPGFATACNQGANATRAPWLLFLNPDCLLEWDTVARLLAVAATDQPRDDELTVAVERGPGPYVAKTKFALHLFRYVFFFRIAERPNFIALNLFCSNVLNRVVMKQNTSPANINQQFRNSVY